MSRNNKINTIVKVSNLTKFYGKTKGIEKVSFEIHEGEIYGLMGPNGAGKTTTLRSMLNLISSDSGKTNILGKDVNELSSKEISHISYLPGEFEMYSNLTGKQYLTYISNLRNAKTNNIHLLSDQLDLDLNKKINALSKGNKQKIGIVQAFMNSPKLAILDEPTSGLDPLKQQEFQNIVKEQNKKGCSVLLSSHILNEIEDLCEKVGIIKDGTLIASEQISALKNKTIKKYEVTFENPPSENKLSEIKGIYDLKIKDEIATFTIKGNIDDMIKTISKFTVINLRILEPDLEEIFLTYYHKA
ncbi:MAG: ABC transporter [Chloroflexi bacterium]|nr:ABC transporter [Chloroflexota bacterium]|tara:strand:+ start:240 stop:1142 length:903 start_codon:yes stop_codon:yes gene_type:complete